MKNLSKILAFTILIASCSIISNKANTAYTVEQHKIVKTDIKKSMNQYFKAMNKKDWELVMDRTYPRVFKFASKEQMINVFSGLKDLGIDMFFKSFTINKMTPPVYKDNEVFHRIFYKSKIQIQLSGDIVAGIDVFAEELKKTYGNDIKIDRETNMVYVNGYSSMVAISEKGKSKWTFMEFNEGETAFLKKLLTKKMYRKLKAFDEN